jgi:hypothetical protein
MSYAPGTTFRIYTADNSKHYTAVLLKDGQVLEVKNPDTGTKTTFPSLTMWCASHAATEEDVKVDASKGSGIVIGTDTNGFNYPNGNHSAFNWIKWCYSIVKEIAPQLLDSSEFKIAYNNMVEIITKHKQELYDYNNYNSGDRRYSLYNIHFDDSNKAYASKWCGYNGRFQCDNNYSTYYSGTKNKNGYSKDDCDKARTEIVSAYKTILDIINPKITDLMDKKFKIARAEKDIRYSQAAIKRTQNKLDKLKVTIDWYKSDIEKQTANLAKLHLELITSKTASM